jgi:4-hydroxy-3-polyprenylbenzoate decarboxylase
MANAPIIVGISGASGAVYGVRLLEVLKANGLPAELVISKSAAQTLKEETNFSTDYVRSFAEVTYQNTDIGAAISSGSYKPAQFARFRRSPTVRPIIC